MRIIYNNVEGEKAHDIYIGTVSRGSGYFISVVVNCICRSLIGSPVQFIQSPEL